MSTRTTTKLTAEEIAQFARRQNCPKLARVAEAANTGAVNVLALTLQLGEGLREIPFHEVSTHPAVKVVIGHISYLLGESAGPSYEALENYEVWSKQE